MQLSHLSLTALTLLSSTCTPLLAEQNRQDTPQDLGTLVLEGAAPQAEGLQSALSTFETPQALGITTTDELRDQQAHDIQDAARNISGVLPPNRYEGVLAKPLVRGLGAAYYIDGQSAYQGERLAAAAGLIGFEQLEAFKGANATMFGGGTGAPVGGVLNLVGKSPQPEFFADIGLRVGSEALRHPHLDLNTPLGASAGLRLAADHETRESHIETIKTKRFSINPTLALDFGPDTTLVLRGHVSELSQLEYAGLPTVLIDTPGVDPLGFYQADDTPDTVIKNRMFTAELTHALDTGATAKLRARRYATEFDENATFPYLAFMAGQSAPLLRARLTSDIEEHSVDASLGWSTTGLGGMHNLLVGLSWNSVDYKARSGFDLNPIGFVDYTSGAQGLSFGRAPALTDAQDSTYQTLALYARDEIEIGARTRLALSGRYARYDLEENPGTSGARDLSYDEFDWRAGLSHELSPDIAAFASYGTGSRLVTFFNGDSGRDPKPQTNTSLEAGLKIDMARHGLSGTIAAYELHRRHVPVASASNPLQSVQRGKDRSRGLELDLRWQASTQVSVLANYAYTDARILTDSGLAGSSNEGNHLARVPRHSARLATRYKIDQGRFKGLGLGLGLSYVGRTPTTDSNDNHTRSYVIADAQAWYEWRNLRFDLGITNLTDRTYYQPHLYLEQDVVLPGAPRSVTFNITSRF